MQSGKFRIHTTSPCNACFGCNHIRLYNTSVTAFDMNMGNNPFKSIHFYPLSQPVIFGTCEALLVMIHQKCPEWGSLRLSGIGFIIDCCQHPVGCIGYFFFFQIWKTKAEFSVTSGTFRCEHAAGSCRQTL